jgi:5-oxoprolinase (ATP-hydrolysing)
MTPVQLSSNVESALQAVNDTFTSCYRREYGFELQGRKILVDDLRVRVVGKSVNSSADDSSNWRLLQDVNMTTHLPTPHSISSVYFENGRLSTPVYLLKQFTENATIGQVTIAGVVRGPAIIVQDVATVVVEPNCTAFISSLGDIDIRVHGAADTTISATVVDPIYLSIFAHRFMGIAEQMGRTLQRTSISVNIKERLDFSCALFDCNGGLVANAPHLPVHLGAMSEAVRYQVKHWLDNDGANGGLQDGDVLVSNHPQLAGGSHLPDITVITPIFR